VGGILEIGGYLGFAGFGRDAHDQRIWMCLRLQTAVSSLELEPDSWPGAGTSGAVFSGTDMLPERRCYGGRVRKRRWFVVAIPLQNCEISGA
jgi:hypothetical protein